MDPLFVNRPLSRREVLCRIGGGFGALGLSPVFARARRPKPSLPQHGVNPLAPRAPHFTPRAKRLIFLFMNGGPSHVDTFDPKPALKRNNGRPLPASFTGGRGTQRPSMGSRFRFHKAGHSGTQVTALLPHVAGCIDHICVLRSLYTANPHHPPR